VVGVKKKRPKTTQRSDKSLSVKWDGPSSGTRKEAVFGIGTPTKHGESSRAAHAVSVPFFWIPNEEK
jgi:hypothetical protein